MRIAPNTTPESFGVVAAIYLRSVSTRLAGRRLWTAAIVILSHPSTSTRCLLDDDHESRCGMSRPSLR